MEYFNEMEVVFDSRSENEGFARVAVAAFMTQMDLVLEEVADVKTAVSEAVTNSIIHGYEGRTSGKITVWCGIEKDKKTILVTVKIRASVSKTWSRRWSHSIRPGRIWIGPGWDLHLWRHLWMKYRWNLCLEKGLRFG